MPNVTHVKKARKDNPVCKAGESYYWWKFRNGGRHYSLTYPKRDQLTQSPYLSVIYSCEDQWSALSDREGWEVNFGDKVSLVVALDTIADSMEGIKDELFELVDQYEEAANNMEEYFSGVERIDQLRECGMECEATCDEIDTMVEEFRSTGEEIDGLDDPDEDDDDEVEEWEESAQGLVDALSFGEPNFDFHEL